MAADPPLFYLPLPEKLVDKDGYISRPWALFFQNMTGAVPADGAATNGVASGITQLTGDVTAGPGTGSQVANISAHAVALGDIQTITTQRALGRDTAGTGDVEQVTISQMLDWTP